MEMTFGGTPVTLQGQVKEKGDEAPDFKAINTELELVSLSDFEDSDFIVLTTVPSIDTGTCDYMTKRFNKDLAEMEDVTVITISNDLPFAQKRWCANEGMENIHIFSDHRDLDFAEKYGTLMKEVRLQARTVFVLDKSRAIIYAEYVQEASEHPDYEAVKEILERKRQ